MYTKKAPTKSGKGFYSPYAVSMSNTDEFVGFNRLYLNLIALLLR